MPNHHLENSDEGLRKLSPSVSIMSERGVFDVNYKRDDCIIDSVRSSLSGHSDNCSSPPMKQQLTSIGNLQVCRNNGFNIRQSMNCSVGHAMDENQLVYQKGQNSSARHKNGFNQLQSGTRKYPEYSYNNVYNESASFSGQFSTVSNYDQRSYVNNHVESMNSSMYGAQIPYPSNDFFYGTQSPHDTDPTTYIAKNPVNDFSNHQGHLLNSPNIFHNNHRAVGQTTLKDTGDGLCQDFSWMREKKAGKKIHEARRKWRFDDF